MQIHQAAEALASQLPKEKKGKVRIWAPAADTLNEKLATMPSRTACTRLAQCTGRSAADALLIPFLSLQAQSAKAGGMKKLSIDVPIADESAAGVSVSE